MGQVTDANVDDVFAYHAPRPDQIPHYEAIRQGARAFAHVLLEHGQPSADLSTALRHVRDAMMTANASVALDGKI